MNKNTNNIPQLRLADGYEEPVVLLMLGNEQALLSAKDAVALAARILDLQSAFWSHLHAVRRNNTIAQADGNEIIIAAERQVST